MFVDKKCRLFGKINILDLIIIIIILFGIYFLYSYYYGSNKEEITTIDIQYEVEFTLKSTEFVYSIEKGDTIRDSIKGNYLGTVSDVKIRPSTKTVENLEEGIFVEAEVPGSYDAVVTIEGKGRVTDTSIFLEGTEIVVGKKMYLKGKGYASQCFITGISY